MKKNLWTEEMLRTLAELYPMETNAFTASVLQVGETAVKEKARELGITRHSVSRIAGKLGLKRSKPESYQVSSRVRMEMIRRERRRVIFGLDPVTRIKVISHRAKVRLRSRLKSKGYVISGHKNVMYFTDHTQRKEKLENKATKLGLTFQPFPDDEVILLPNAI